MPMGGNHNRRKRSKEERWHGSSTASAGRSSALRATRNSSLGHRTTSTRTTPSSSASSPSRPARHGRGGVPLMRRLPSRSPPRSSPHSSCACHRPPSRRRATSPARQLAQRRQLVVRHRAGLAPRHVTIGSSDAVTASAAASAASLSMNSGTITFSSDPTLAVAAPWMWPQEPWPGCDSDRRGRLLEDERRGVRGYQRRRRAERGPGPQRGGGSQRGHHVRGGQRRRAPRPAEPLHQQHVHDRRRRPDEPVPMHSRAADPRRLHRAPDQGLERNDQHPPWNRERRHGHRPERTLSLEAPRPSTPPTAARR